MKIAVPYENGMVFQHFGHTAEFKFYEVENGQVTASEVVSTNGQGHGALVDFLAQHNANAVFCGGIGPGAQNALAQAGIQLFGGISGPADAAVADYLAGKLRKIAPCSGVLLSPMLCYNKRKEKRRHPP